MASSLRQVFRQWNLSYRTGWQPLLRRIWGEKFHIRQFPFPQKVSIKRVSIILLERLLAFWSCWISSLIFLRYGVALVGVRPAELPEFYEDTILLNPGPRHIMKSSDTCYYMSITKEENSAFVISDKQEMKPVMPKDQTACSLLSNEKKLADPEEGTSQPRRPDGSSVLQYELPQVILEAPPSSTPLASPSRINPANTVSSANFTVASCECHSWTNACWTVYVRFSIFSN